MLSQTPTCSAHYQTWSNKKCTLILWRKGVWTGPRACSRELWVTFGRNRHPTNVGVWQTSWGPRACQVKDRPMQRPCGRREQVRQLREAPLSAGVGWAGKSGQTLIKSVLYPWVMAQWLHFQAGGSVGRVPTVRKQWRHQCRKLRDFCRNLGA